MNAGEIGELLAITDKLMRRIRGKDNFPRVPRVEFFVMMIISDFERNELIRTGGGHKGITVTNIANILFASPGNISRMLRGMEEKGYIIRKPDDTDRRVVYFSLTAEGEEIIRKARGEVEDRFLRIVERMGREDAAEYLRLSRKLGEILSDERE